MEQNKKKVPAKRIQLVDVVLERKGSQLFEGRRVRSPIDAANIIRDFIGDSDRERFVVLGLSTKNEPQVLQVVHTGFINSSIVHPRDVMKALILANCASCIVAHNHPSNDGNPILIRFWYHKGWCLSSPEDYQNMSKSSAERISVGLFFFWERDRIFRIC